MAKSDESSVPGSAEARAEVDRIEQRLPARLRRAIEQGQRTIDLYLSTYEFPLDAEGRPKFERFAASFAMGAKTGRRYGRASELPTPRGQLDAERPFSWLATANLNGGPARSSSARLDAFVSDLVALKLKRVEVVANVEPQLAYSMGDIRATKQELRDPRHAESTALPGTARPYDGHRVIVGIVDFGCDFAHRNFRKANGRTRIKRLYDQNTETEYTQEAIDAALRQRHPYAALGYDPHANYYMGADAADVTAAHGTHVMDIAAGNGTGTGVKGVAPGADIVFVQVKLTQEGGRRYASAYSVYKAVEYVRDYARSKGRPAVVNVSLNTNDGPHDGRSGYWEMLDQLVGDGSQPGEIRALVLAAGNYYQDRLHANWSIASNGTHRLSWQVRKDDVTPNRLAIWFEVPASASRHETTTVTIVGPGQPAQFHGPVEPGARLTISDGNVERGTIVGAVVDSQRAGTDENGKPVPYDLKKIEIMLDPSARPSNRRADETWHIDLRTEVDRGQVPSMDILFDAYIDRDNDKGTNQSCFSEACAASSGTLGSLACGRASIAVGSYSALGPSRGLSFFSSAGPVRVGQTVRDDTARKPELSAPGTNIYAAVSKADPGAEDPDDRHAPTVGMSGSSMAAAHVSGVIALMLQKNPTLSPAALRTLLKKIARRGPPGFRGDRRWHPRYGYGRIDAVIALKKTPLPPPS